MNTILVLGYMYPRLTLNLLSLKINLLILITTLFVTLIINKKKINKEIMIVFLINIPFIASIIFSNIYNKNFDLFILTYISLQIIYLFYIIIFKNIKLSLENFMNIYITIITFQNIFGVLFFLYPKLGVMLNNFIYLDILQKETIKGLIGLRFVGLGSAFFGAGIDCGIALLFIVYLYMKERKKGKILLYIFNFFIGMLMARTTLVGFLMSIFMFIIFSMKRSIKENTKVFFKIMQLILFLPFIVIFFLNFSDKFENILKWGFEIFINLFKNGEVSTKSTTAMLKFYKIVPDNLKTLLIGDGYWHYNGGYYKGVDIGYLRILFYSGLNGLIFFIVSKFTLFLLILIYRKNFRLAVLSFVIFIFDLILNFKGYVSLNSIQYILFLLISEKREINE